MNGIFFFCLLFYTLLQVSDPVELINKINWYNKLVYNEHYRSILVTSLVADGAF